MEREKLLQRLEPPQGRVAMVLDTDTYNEIDDQFALVYAALAGERLDLKAVCAAPFANARSKGPADGMEKSWAEIHRVLEHLGFPAEGLVYRGSTRFMDADKRPVSSEAAACLVELAQAQPADELLYVVAIGAITNVASALLLDPAVAERIAVVWLGGHPHYWPNNREFNLYQDPHSAQVVLDSGVPFIHVPCKNVAEHVKSTVPEMAELFKGRGAIGDYLYEIFAGYEGMDEPTAWSKEIWDLAAVAWLVNPDFMPSQVVPTPLLNTDEDCTWSFDPGRHPSRVCMDAKRDRIFRDLVSRLDGR